MIEIAERDGTIAFLVRVTPRSGPNLIEGEHQGALKIKLTAPPTDNRANEALRRFLAESLRVSISAVRIIAGEKSRTKRVGITGVTRAQVTALLNSHLC